MDISSKKIDTITHNLTDLFPEATIIEAQECVDMLEISLEQSRFAIINTDKLKSLMANVDRTCLSVKQEFPDNKVSCNSDDQNYSAFIDELKSQIDKNEPAKIVYRISKDVQSRKCKVYSSDYFYKWLESISCLQLLKTIKPRLIDVGELQFELPCGNQVVIKKPDNNEQINNSISKNCHFADFKDFPFNAKWFKDACDIDNALGKKIKEIFFIFLLVGLCDYTSIEESKIVCKFSGTKTISAELLLKELNVDTCENYRNIYDWVYAKESEKISDSLGIARNIIVVYINDNNIAIDDKVFTSIKSNFKIYLQRNIDRYFEIKIKLSDHMNQIVESLSMLSDRYLDNFKTSCFGAFSFFITVFLMSYFTTGKSVFTKEVTLFAFVFYLLSIIHLVLSLVHLRSDHNYLKTKYASMKKRYKDLLVEEDINKILANDDEFIAAKSRLRWRRFQYSLLWLINTVFLAVATYCVSDFHNLKPPHQSFFLWLFG